MLGYILGALGLIFIVFMPLHFGTKKCRSRLPSLIAKVLSTLLAAVFAGYGYFVLGHGSYALLVFIGLCLCTAADWVLEVRFEIGGALFFLGHVFYVLALALYRVLSWWCLTAFVLALAGLWWFLSRYNGEISSNRIRAGLSIYAVALAALLGFSLPLPFLAPSGSALCAALGAGFFVASDLTLLHNALRKKPFWNQYISLGMYYTGQLLLALSVYPVL